MNEDKMKVERMNALRDEKPTMVVPSKLFEKAKKKYGVTHNVIVDRASSK